MRTFCRTLASPRMLPRLPIPKLEMTVKRYLESIEPLLPSHTSRSGESVDEARRIRQKYAEEFLMPGGLGRRLQQRLVDLDRASPNNWLDDTIWMRVAYLESREPLMINSNWWLTLENDLTVPEKIRNGTLVDTQLCRRWQIRRAAWLVKRFLDYRGFLLVNKIPSLGAHSGVWFRESALRLYGTTRIPKPGCDSVVLPGCQPGSSYIHVMFHDWSYELQVTDLVGGQVPAREVEAGLLGIVDDVLRRERDGESPILVGVLTADARDLWATNREHLISIHEQNWGTMGRIESSLFTLCLDDHTLPPVQPTMGGVLDGSHVSGHIRNTASGLSGNNRWFDKSLSLILESNTRFGVMGEHSPLDALIPSTITDWALEAPIDIGEFASDSWYPSRHEPGGWKQLNWKVDQRVLDQCSAAQTRAESLISGSDARELWFKDYGAKWIREASLSPDAYIQAALQLTYFRLHGSLTATYETASTRLFRHGRTETIRSLTTEMAKFICAMTTETPYPERYQRLRSALAFHHRVTRMAATGHGIDRHLLGLRLQMRPGESSDLFDDELFRLSQDWKLSTSGLSAGDRFTATGFGAAVKDGYGINYLTGENMLKFGIESKRTSTVASTGTFCQGLVESLNDMKDTCVRGSIIYDPKL
ncbi:acyltransferase ChoActase COT CPT [Cantharellus anzutake]|uniref:acyltransferase ChoActase COT CPT n=1 Tax=Cantharellus anzutake TaxID=1750568 RepID=UPI001903AFC1|nr:acyltransferase ChoActase COT CPT [Cantharellus anzutake]XP_038908834.1 acyltransferase ChoActase COT CPT [Cantharellus anzutake]KAF8308923.1 acyltransferase ChoActase COT CPT [Cantharellus anzutake]KAF8315295.1 acyltransferase ChoActase COT CPT [Cantharellus anzutake]